ncbi:MAG: methylenetetrahydrofolate--tRNA-(uracil(54)-C(5))-methyltransferase (FADH(2)-oxidizing) TrmFO [Clostridia bacterium]|nr:methylenetetrahydrofolate--tRNA-(uracil(54)-C(5))-methyltransferase (FADH(2)-oxidizing) TrmFO [Clostridia bacterium]
MMPTIHVIGAGLAGCEAAYIAARLGCRVFLHEMKPQKYSPAHHNPDFCELVCSNSFRSNQLTNAIGLLKAELSSLSSLIMEAAYETEVSAGSALAVDRSLFAQYVTQKIRSHERITVVEEEVTELPKDAITVVATGPLTSDAFSETLKQILSEESLHFYDAAAPIVDAATINTDIAFAASRYGKGEACYLNCPMDREQYEAFYEALITAEEAKLHEFDTTDSDGKALTVFEGCMPVEVMARRGKETLLFGPLKPVGLPDPKTGKEFHAVVQLRRENNAATMYNLVGFQTHLTFSEQKRVFRMIPGLENAEFLRYGVMHRNTFINSPKLLNTCYAMKTNPHLFFAGQMTGVEGYIESASSGYVAGLNAALTALGKDPCIFPDTTAIGALSHYISSATTQFQPMNVNFGIIAPLDKKVKGGKAARNEALSARALATVETVFHNRIKVDFVD